MDKRTILIGSSIFLFFVLIYLLMGLVWSPESTESASDNDANAAVALFGGGGMPSDSGGQDASLYGSDFWKAGVPDKAIDTSDVEMGGNDTGLLDPASEGNPINPQTGQRYPDSVMKQFDTLREKFPDNHIIPRRLTQEEKDQENHKKMAMQEIQRKINTSGATTSEINSLYDYEIKSVNDRLELINYVVESQGEKMDPDIKEKFQKILDLN
ncbi:MAG: hypothetical protein OEZ34_13220, partial [Spirochaetia bacterium]|nr:hypothetical protein [Spirochaetia bacterium]